MLCSLRNEAMPRALLPEERGDSRVSRRGLGWLLRDLVDSCAGEMPPQCCNRCLVHQVRDRCGQVSVCRGETGRAYVGCQPREMAYLGICPMVDLVKLSARSHNSAGDGGSITIRTVVATIACSD